MTGTFSRSTYGILHYRKSKKVVRVQKCNDFMLICTTQFSNQFIICEVPLRWFVVVSIEFEKWTIPIVYSKWLPEHSAGKLLAHMVLREIAK